MAFCITLHFMVLFDPTRFASITLVLVDCIIRGALTTCHAFLRALFVTLLCWS